MHGQADLTFQNEHIGKNLHLHPCNYVLGRFDEDIRPWEGGVITAVCEELNNLDGHGHGVNLETTSMIVRRAATFVLPWDATNEDIGSRSWCSPIFRGAAAWTSSSTP